MRLLVYEGTPDEIRQAVADLPKVEAAQLAEVQAAPTAAAGEDETDGYVSVEFARSLLNRRPLSKEQKMVLVALYEASPSLVPAPELQKLIGYTPSQFAGLMGAFGRRLTHTPNYVDPSWLFVQDWNYEGGYNDYGLPETVREAMRLEQLV